MAKDLSLKLFHTSVKKDKNVEPVFAHLATSFQCRDKDKVEVEEISGSVQPIQIADTRLGLKSKEKQKKQKGILKSKSSCAII